MKPLSIIHLYAKEMNLYGDTGNRLVLEKRLQWRNLPYHVHLVSVGDPMPKQVDILLAGGGQDATQGALTDDLMRRKKEIARLLEDGTPMLLICGMYQMMGHRFITKDGVKIPGLSLFDIETRGDEQRIIGNIVTTSDLLGELVGYENHSGRTYLGAKAQPMSEVLKGLGNNDEDKTEGCVVNAAFGTYMHGPVLSKNPQFADHLLSLAYRKNNLDVELSKLDDSLEHQAHVGAKQRPR